MSQLPVAYSPERLAEYTRRTVIMGETKVKVYKEVFDEHVEDSTARKQIRKMESSEQYFTILAASEKALEMKVKSTMVDAVNTHYEAYSELLREGQGMIAKAKTQEDKIAAMETQRTNLGMNVIVNAQNNMLSSETKGADMESVII